MKKRIKRRLVKGKFSLDYRGKWYPFEMWVEETIKGEDLFPVVTEQLQVKNKLGAKNNIQRLTITEH